MKEEALKLADELQDYMTSLGWKTHQAPDMIRRLVEELDEKNYRILELTKRYKALDRAKPLSDEEITYQFQHKCPRFSRLDIFKYAVKWAEERHGIK